MPEQEEPGAVLSSWQFVEQEPTPQKVVELLASLPPVWGVQTVEFVDYVQPLGQNQKVKRKVGKVKVDEYLQTWTLYVTVAGRIKMMERAADLNGWQVSYVPEPSTSLGIPGLLVYDERIVYREYAEVWKDGTLIGRKPGMSAVKAVGGPAVEASNPWEVVETSARGRSLAAWGFGVLPGSGVASLEEVRYALRERQAPPVGQQTDQAEGNGRSREEMLENIATLSEGICQTTGRSREEQDAKLVKYVTDRLGVRGAVDEETGEIDWSTVKTGQLSMIVNDLRASLQTFRQQQAEL